MRKGQRARSEVMGVQAGLVYLSELGEKSGVEPVRLRKPPTALREIPHVKFGSVI